MRPCHLSRQYGTAEDMRLWVIIEGGFRATPLLLPDEY
jgi:hypothetical protein